MIKIKAALVLFGFMAFQANAQMNIELKQFSHWKSMENLREMGIDRLPVSNGNLNEMNVLVQPLTAEKYLSHLQQLLGAREQIGQFLGENDFQWESCAANSKTLKFQTLDDFIVSVPSKASGYNSIMAFVESFDRERSDLSKTPMDLSQELHHLADKVLSDLKKSVGPNTKGAQTLIKETRAMAYLVKYYAFKIAGAVETAKYRNLATMKKEHQKYGVREMTNAQVYWRMYADLMSDRYPNPLWMHKKQDDLTWSRTLRLVLDDIDLAKDVLF